MVERQSRIIEDRKVPNVSPGNGVDHMAHKISAVLEYGAPERGETATIMEDKLRFHTDSWDLSVYWAGLPNNAHGPVVTLRVCRPRVADRTSRADLGIDHQLGARAQPSPSKRRAGCSLSILGAEHTREIPKPLGAALRHKKGDPAQPAGLGGRRSFLDHRASADETRHQSSRLANRTETARRCRQCPE
jgi:hypothetical protein